MDSSLKGVLSVDIDSSALGRGVGPLSLFCDERQLAFIVLILTLIVDSSLLWC
jgi:hypothetical protein